MKTTTIYLKGMHCNACKLLVEKTLIQLPAIQAVDANVRKGQVRLKYAGKLDMDEVIALIRANGYEVVDTPPHRPRLSTNINDYKILLISLLSFLFLYWILQQTGTATRFDIQADTPSLGMVLLIGLTAGFSSCMAVIGGLVLAISSKWNLQHTEKSFGKKLLPHFRFNAGRLVGFGVLGGVLGMFGSIVSLSPVSLAVMTLLVGVVMLLLGVNLTGISPKVSGFSISLPTFRLFSLKSGSLFGRLSRFEGQRKAFGSGILTFFLPCGFTFAMQLYAIQTGSFRMGAVVMLLFAVGTLPGLVGIGSLTSMFRGKIAHIAYKVVGVLVILLGLYNIANSYGVVRGAKGNISQLSNAVNREIINLTYTTKGLQPSVVELEVGKDYTLKIAVETTVYGCMSTIYVAGLNTDIQTLSKGNLIVFDVSPTKAGTYEFRCAMGIPHEGKVVVKQK